MWPGSPFPRPATCHERISREALLAHRTQEAKKRMAIKRLPNVLALHLKRFKYMEQLQARD